MFTWLFRNRQTGRITIAQAPNLALAVFGGAWLIRAVLNPSGALGVVLLVVQIGALVIWAGDEIVRGVNPWRRILGATVLAVMVLGWITRL